NFESYRSETERPRTNAVDSETRPRPLKSGLETKTGLEYYNTRAIQVEQSMLGGERGQLKPHGAGMSAAH
ncbi:hypothetical protein NQZ68_019355, partial [Dissostichus eleginoides]